MAIDVIVPRFGWSMEKGVFSEWFKKDGDEVKSGDKLFSVEADKAVEEVISEDEGILHIIPGRAKAGDELPVGTVVGYLLGPGEKISDEASASPPAATPSPAPAPAANKEEPAVIPPPARAEPPKAAAVKKPGIARTQSLPARIQVAKTLPTSEGRLRASPRARRVSRELAVDLRAVAGTGRGGRIVERDVRLASESGRGLEAASAAPVSSIHLSADLTELIGLLDRMRFEGGDPVLQMGHYRGLLVKLAVAAYRNAFLDGDFDSDIDIAYGSSRDEGISYRPISAVNRKAIGALALEVGAEDSSDTALSGAEAFALVDLGAFGIDEYSPGLELPCGLLLCFGRLTREGPAEAQCSPAIRVGLSFCEDVVSFAQAARFLDALRCSLGDPLLWLA
jgi:hypothetical protein